MDTALLCTVPCFKISGPAGILHTQVCYSCQPAFLTSFLTLNFSVSRKSTRRTSFGLLGYNADPGFLQIFANADTTLSESAKVHALSVPPGMELQMLACHSEGLILPTSLLKNEHLAVLSQSAVNSRLTWLYLETGSRRIT